MTALVRLACGVAALAVAGAAWAGGASGGGCGRPPPRADARLPAPVVVQTTGPPLCALRVLPGGRVERIPWRSSFRGPRSSVIFPLTAPEVAVLSRRGRLIIVPTGGGPAIWRSRGRYPRTRFLGLIAGVAVSSTRIALAVADDARDPARLLIAPIDGPERQIAGVRGESPVGWTAAGDLVTREGRATLRLRRSNGTLVRTLARGAGWFDWDPRSRTAVVADRGRLRRVGSGPDIAVADLGALGLGRPGSGPNVEIAGAGRIVIVGRGALVVLRADGSIWARAAFPRGPEIAGQGSLTTSQDGRAIAFANVRHRAGLMSVEPLREGDRRSRTLLRRSFVARPGWSTGLSWRGPWLLSWSTDGAVNALRPGAGARVRLDVVGQRLARARSGAGIEARWGRR